MIERLSDLEEDVMVRHEAAEALGAIGDQIAMATLREFVDDDSIVVAESCEVAIDLLDYVSSKGLIILNMTTVDKFSITLGPS